MYIGYVNRSNVITTFWNRKERRDFSLKYFQSPTKKTVKFASGDENRSLYVSRALEINIKEIKAIAKYIDMFVLIEMGIS